MGGRAVRQEAAAAGCRLWRGADLPGVGRATGGGDERVSDHPHMRPNRADRG